MSRNESRRNGGCGTIVGAMAAYQSLPAALVPRRFAVEIKDRTRHPLSRRIWLLPNVKSIVDWHKNLRSDCVLTFEYHVYKIKCDECDGIQFAEIGQIVTFAASIVLFRAKLSFDNVRKAIS